MLQQKTLMRAPTVGDEFLFSRVGMRDTPSMGL